ncbi:chemoreceptor glutamine deamidase CheD [Pseudohoeflea coraliihabitans]|uniref:Probable chemoreceptor glutamine deamidase CheD n=1 Tax=Pseudohoeflea coraliihabitans TaxID=2860393 RepID=A0ABS6WNC6_9HYPH|nr:chemoreceptor glutamine deamidase CheD [Pseudohoeflea sp. DP4N28-3]
MNQTVPPRRIHVIQGEFKVSDDPSVVLCTILGSCVAACLRDPVAGIGGMNHFLLPGTAESSGLSTGSEATRYGVHLMELLINGLLKAGADRDRLEAKIIGGARTIATFSNVGEQNAVFARSFLRDEGIRIVGSNIGGDYGRKLEYWPVSGRARQIPLTGAETQKTVAEENAKPRPQADKPVETTIEFF